MKQDVGKFELNDEAQTAWLATDKGGWISACVIDEFVFFSRAVTAKQVDEIFTKDVDEALSVDGKKRLSTIWADLKNNRR